MPDYLFLDGPLAGQVLALAEPHATGQLVTVEVVDAVQQPGVDAVFDYLVEVEQVAAEPGLLRHVRPAAA